MQRAYDQLIHDVAIQNLNVVFCLDRGGLVGSDGATHHGAFDLAYMRNIPNLIVSAPMDEKELRDLMYTAQKKAHGPFSIRYPRGCGSHVNWRTPMEELEIGKGRKLHDGNQLAILTIGTAGIQAYRAVKKLARDGIEVAHYDLRFVKPIDEELLHEVFQKFSKIVTVEDGVVQGGFGSAVLEFMSTHNYQSKLTMMGIPDRFIEHGTIEELQRECGYNFKGIYKTVKDILS